MRCLGHQGAWGIGMKGNTVNRIASVFIATSLDGFIAREDGDIEWLNDANKVAPEGEDCGYSAFMNSC